MATQSYRVGEGANLKLYPRGTKVGDVVKLTEAQALYELDMGRLEVVAADEPVPGETKGYPVDSATGEPIDLTDEERARIQAAPDLDTTADAPAVATLADPAPEAKTGDAAATKARRGR